MLKSILIKNFTIIQSAQFSFDRGFNILTGETGAGKSLVLEALDLVLGARADVRNIVHPELKKNVVIEAEFELDSRLINRIPLQQYVDEKELTLRRVIMPSGKSRHFINDHPIRQQDITPLKSLLVDVHKQFENGWLFQKNSQLDIIDAFLKDKLLLDQYHEAYTSWRDCEKELHELKIRQKEYIKEKDYLEYQFKELSDMDLFEVDEQAILSEMKLLQNANFVKEKLSECLALLNDEKFNAVDAVREFLSNLESLPIRNEDIDRWISTAHNCFEELRSLESDIAIGRSNTEENPERLHILNSKYDEIQRLLNKHQLQNVDELLHLQASLERKLSISRNVEEDIVLRTEQNSKLRQEAYELAKSIHISRVQVSKKFSEQVSDKLKSLSMRDAQFEVFITEHDELNEHGLTDVTFLFSANKGQATKNIKEIASGGERSRIALCIKSTVAGHLSMPILIFDEIDSGVSGDVSLKMSKVIKELSENHQVLCITHSPQIAASGDRHIYIYKENEDNQTVSKHKILSTEDRISEIAKMLSGNPPSEAALKNAENLLLMN